MPWSDTPPAVAVVAALPREVAGLVCGVAADPELVPRGIHLYRIPGAVVAVAGMGAERAALAVEAALARGKITALISTGLAGSCSTAFRAGTVAEARVVIDASTGERFMAQVPSGTGATLVTTHAIAGVQQKTRLRASYEASLVDMEGATIARLAAANGLPFRAIKGISDGADFELAALSRFAGRHGSFRTGAFALHTAFRPRHWGRALRLGRDSSRALAALGPLLREVIQRAAR